MALHPDCDVTPNHEGSACPGCSPTDRAADGVVWSDEAASADAGSALPPMPPNAVRYWESERDRTAAVLTRYPNLPGVRAWHDHAVELLTASQHAHEANHRLHVAQDGPCQPVGEVHTAGCVSAFEAGAARARQVDAARREGRAVIVRTPAVLHGPGTRSVAAGKLGPTDSLGRRPYDLAFVQRGEVRRVPQTVLLPPLPPPTHPEDTIRLSPFARTRRAHT